MSYRPSPATTPPFGAQSTSVMMIPTSISIGENTVSSNPLSNDQTTCGGNAVAGVKNSSFSANGSTSGSGRLGNAKWTDTRTSRASGATGEPVYLGNVSITSFERTSPSPLRSRISPVIAPMPSPGSRGSTPQLAPAVAVPLITPRYQKKTRTNREMIISDTSVPRTSTTGALLERRTEDLSIRNGHVSYTEEVHFQPYDLFRTGKNKVHRRSVGYSSDGELVLTREDLSEMSDNEISRRHTTIDSAVCLNPRVGRPLTEEEQNTKDSNPKRCNPAVQKYKKYPGVHAPKNKKIRNRLMNDHFATEYAKKLLALTRQQYEDEEDEVEDYLGSCRVRPIFGDIPECLMDMFDMSEREQMRMLKANGVSSAQFYGTASNGSAPPKDRDSGESRFLALTTRLRTELQRALGSEFLTNQIVDLEAKFSKYVADGIDEPLKFCFRDGYGRLISHGVASYYQLHSHSVTEDDGSKTTVISLPKNKKKRTVSVNLPHQTLMEMLRKGSHGGLENGGEETSDEDEDDENEDINGELILPAAMSSPSTVSKAPLQTIQNNNNKKKNARQCIGAKGGVVDPSYENGSTTSSSCSPVTTHPHFQSVQKPNESKNKAQRANGRKPAAYGNVSPTLDYDHDMVIDAMVAEWNELDEEEESTATGSSPTTSAGDANEGNGGDQKARTTRPVKAAAATVERMTEEELAKFAAQRDSDATAAATRSIEDKKRQKKEKKLREKNRRREEARLAEAAAALAAGGEEEADDGTENSSPTSENSDQIICLAGPDSKNGTSTAYESNRNGRRKKRGKFNLIDETTTYHPCSAASSKKMGIATKAAAISASS